MIEGQLTVSGRGEKAEGLTRYNLYGGGPRGSFDLKVESGDEKPAAAFSLTFGFAWAQPLTIDHGNTLSCGVISLVFSDEKGNRLQVDLDPMHVKELQRVIQKQIKAYNSLVALDAA